jgi:hypothetical protein
MAAPASMVPVAATGGSIWCPPFCSSFCARHLQGRFDPVQRFPSSTLLREIRWDARDIEELAVPAVI